MTNFYKFTLQYYTTDFPDIVKTREEVARTVNAAKNKIKNRFQMYTGKLIIKVIKKEPFEL